MRYMRGLNEWLGRDVNARQEALGGLATMINQLRADVSRLGAGAGVAPRKSTRPQLKIRLMFSSLAMPQPQGAPPAPGVVPGFVYPPVVPQPPPPAAQPLISVNYPVVPPPVGLEEPVIPFPDPMIAGRSPPVAQVFPSPRRGFIPPDAPFGEVRPHSPYRHYPEERDEGFIPHPPSPRSATHPVIVQPPTVYIPPSPRSRSSRTDTQETYRPEPRSPAPLPVSLGDEHPIQLGRSRSPTPPAPQNIINVGQTPAIPPPGQVHPSPQEPMLAHEPYPMGPSPMGPPVFPPTIPIGGTPPLMPMPGVPPTGPIVIQPAPPMALPQPVIPSHPPSRADLRSPREHEMMEMPASPRRTHRSPHPEHFAQPPPEHPLVAPGSPSIYAHQEPRVVTLPTRTYDYDSDGYYYPRGRRGYYDDDDDYYYPRRRRRRPPYYDDDYDYPRRRRRHPDSDEDEDEDPHDPRRLRRRPPQTEEADRPHPTQPGEPQVSPGERDAGTYPATREVPRTPALPEDHDEGTQLPRRPAVAEEELPRRPAVAEEEPPPLRRREREEEPSPRREERDAELHEYERRRPEREDGYRRRPSDYTAYSPEPGDRDYDRRRPSPSIRRRPEYREGDAGTLRSHRPLSPIPPTIVRLGGEDDDGHRHPVIISPSPQSPRPYSGKPS
ncbi:hypothetical protein EV401DRAFT_740849 [Pisolithus croceorrhizus]|nr:hypothetical protein EV401DRAFT_740849 [Pisolithus croceorrhizus]